MEKISPPWIAAARLLRPQGRRGELLAELLTDQPATFAAGRSVLIDGLKNLSGDSLETTVEDHWLPTGKNAGRIVLKLAGCDSITEAERLAGHELLLPATAFPALEADTWYVRDLAGCTLFNGDTAVGRITGVQYAMASDGRTRLPDAAPLLEVTMGTSESEAEPALIPFIRAWLESVDLEHRRVSMNLPPGLLTLDAAASDLP
jgi:16S rRNA processing protein RimM